MKCLYQQCRLNQLLVCGLSASTTKECVLNFIKAKSSEDVKEVRLRNGVALVTMINDITGKSNGPYSYCRYWTGASMEWRPVQRMPLAFDKTH